jgi:MFS family permease
MARNLRLFYLFRLLATSYLFLPVVVLFQAARGLGLPQIMLLNGVYCAAAIASEVPTGAVADRIGRRRSMMLGSLSLLAGCLVYARAHSFAAFALGTTFEALSMTLTSGADSAYLYDLLVSEGRRADYVACEGTATAAHYLGNALVCAVGGLLAARWLVLPYLVTGGVALLAFCAAFAMREELPGARARIAAAARSRPWPGYRAHIRDSVRTVLRSDRLPWAIGYSALLFVLVRAQDYCSQMWLEAPGRSLDALSVGVVLAVLYLVAAAGSFAVGSLSRKHRVDGGPLVWGTPIVLAACYLALAAVDVRLGLAVLATQAAAGGLFSPVTKALVNHAVPDSSQRATILSVESMMRRLAYGLFSALLLAPMLSRNGLAAALVGCAGAGGLGVAILAVTRTRTRSASSATSTPAPVGAEGVAVDGGEPSPLPQPAGGLATPLAIRRAL